MTRKNIIGFIALSLLTTSFVVDAASAQRDDADRGRDGGIGAELGGQATARAGQLGGESRREEYRRRKLSTKRVADGTCDHLLRQVFDRASGQMIVIGKHPCQIQ